jgi:hypothetical protein
MGFTAKSDEYCWQLQGYWILTASFFIVFTAKWTDHAALATELDWIHQNFMVFSKIIFKCF